MEIQDWLVRSDNVDKLVKVKEHPTAGTTTTLSRWKQSKLSFDNLNITFKDKISTDKNMVGIINQPDCSTSTSGTSIIRNGS